MSSSANDSTLPSGKTARTRLQLVRAIRDELTTTGGFNARQVAARTRNSAATFYNHFATKEAALRAAFEEVMDELVATVERHLLIDRVLEKGLSEFANEWVLICTDHFQRNSMVFRAAQMQLPASRTLRDVFRAKEATSFALYERFIRLGQRARVIRTGDTAAIARIFMLTNEGWQHPSFMGMKQNDPLHREVTRVVVQMLSPEIDVTPNDPGSNLSKHKKGRSAQ